MRKEFRRLVSKAQALNIIETLPLSWRTEIVPLPAAYGRVLAEDIISQIDVPPFDRASMDGYAVHAADTYQAREDRPVVLKVRGTIPAGEFSDNRIETGEAVEISTGAMMPEGADAVVMVEYTAPANHPANSILVRRPVSINENVMHAGTDIMAGEKVLDAGARLTSREIGVLAAVGMMNVPVRSIRAGIISTGNEIAIPGGPLEPGKVYDINAYSLNAAVLECGAQPYIYGIVGDNEKRIEEVLKKVSDECDLILTSGSTSAGSGDVMYRIIQKTGTILVHGIDIKPGKPVIFGLINGKPVFGLPGYPSSALTIFNVFVSPLLRRYIYPEYHATGKKTVPAVLAAGIHTDGRNQMLPVGLVRGIAYPISKGSGAITTLAEADGFIEIPSGVEIMHGGEKVEVELIGGIYAPDLLFIGSHCTGLDVLRSIILPVRMRVINAGSTGGLSAIRNNLADIAGIHLLDESGRYNLPFLSRFGIKDAVLLKGYLREQGLMVRHGSDITGLGGIIGKRVMNRNTGSGTRVLLDLKLKEFAAKENIPFQELCSQIKGYETQAKTHSAVAAAVKLGRADAGIGIRPVADMNGLEFIKIADEEYDFLIQKRMVESREIQTFIEKLRSPEFSDMLPAGLKVYEKTGKIVTSESD